MKRDLLLLSTLVAIMVMTPLWGRIFAWATQLRRKSPPSRPVDSSMESPPQSTTSLHSGEPK